MQWYGYNRRRMRRKLQKLLGRFTLLIVLCLVGMVILNIFAIMMEEFRQRIVDMRDKSQLLTRRRQRSSDKYDVLISSYMNSGSSFTAGMLGLRSDAFYFYEPLWHVTPSEYYRSNATVCSTRLISCRTLTKENMNTNVPERGMPIDFSILHDKDVMEQGSPILVPQRILEHVYNCEISKLQNVIRPDVTIGLSGASWAIYRGCIDRKYRRQECLRQLELRCLSANHRVTKVLRLTVGALDLLLSKFPRLKVVHLFRDPRAIINSRIETNGYPLGMKDQELVQTNAKVLCDKMAVDLREGRQLLEKFPSSFFFAHYEDLFTNDSSLVKLHNELGMSLTRGDVMHARLEKRNHAVDPSREQVAARQRNNAFWWRENLPYNTVAIVDKVCVYIYQQLGYPHVRNSEDLKKYNLTEDVRNLKYAL